MKVRKGTLWRAYRYFIGREAPAELGSAVRRLRTLTAPGGPTCIIETDSLVLMYRGACLDQWRSHVPDKAQDQPAGGHRPGDHPRGLRRVGDRRGRLGVRLGPQEDEESVAAIHRALDLGINWVDTAAAYGFGRSERVVGRAIEGLAERPYVFTKASLLDDGSGHVRHSLKRDSILREAEASLRRLGVDAIDLYQIHWPDPEQDIQEGWSALAELKEQGLVGTSASPTSTSASCAASSRSRRSRRSSRRTRWSTAPRRTRSCRSPSAGGSASSFTPRWVPDS